MAHYWKYIRIIHENRITKCVPIKKRNLDIIHNPFICIIRLIFSRFFSSSYHIFLCIISLFILTNRKLTQHFAIVRKIVLINIFVVVAIFNIYLVVWHCLIVCRFIKVFVCLFVIFITVEQPEIIEKRTRNTQHTHIQRKKRPKKKREKIYDKSLNSP